MPVSSNSQDLWIGLPLAGVSLLVLGGTSRLVARSSDIAMPLPFVAVVGGYHLYIASP
jgi:hypothetical protein